MGVKKKGQRDILNARRKNRKWEHGDPRVQDTGEERGNARETMNVAAVTPGRGETTTKAMIVAAAAAGRDEKTTTTIEAAVAARRDEEMITTNAAAATVEREEKTITVDATAATAERDEMTATKRVSESIVVRAIDVLVPQILEPTVEEVLLFSWVQPRTVEQIVDVPVVMQGQEPVIQKVLRTVQDPQVLYIDRRREFTTVMN